MEMANVHMEKKKYCAISPNNVYDIIYVELMTRMNSKKCPQSLKV